jgi:hypothetical protein
MTLLDTQRFDPVGRRTSVHPSPPTFSREKDHMILQKEAWVSKSMQVIPECPELRSLREAYWTFSDEFVLFNKQNGPNITGVRLSSTFLRFKAAVEPFLLHASHRFSASSHSQAVRRFSPLIQFGVKLLREWSGLVETMNNLSMAPVLPHLHQCQSDFGELAKCVAAICEGNVHRLCHRDTLFIAACSVKSQITATYRHVHRVLARESEHGFSQGQLAVLKRQMASLSHNLHENFLEMLSTSVTTTPEMTRTRYQIKAACGDVVALLDAAFFFRGRARQLLSEMATLHRAIFSLLDDMGIKYQIRLAPIVATERREEDAPKATETPEERVESFVNGVSEMLNIDTAHIESPIEKLDLVERTLKRLLGGGTHKVPRVEIPSPVAARRAQPPPASVLQERQSDRKRMAVSIISVRRVRRTPAKRQTREMHRRPNSPLESSRAPNDRPQQSPLPRIQEGPVSPPPDQIASSQRQEEVASLSQQEEVAPLHPQEEVASLSQHGEVASSPQQEEAVLLSQQEEVALLSQQEEVASSQPPEELISAGPEEVEVMAPQEEGPPESEGEGV